MAKAPAFDPNQPFEPLAFDPIAYTREKATKLGLDPDLAVAVGQTESGWNLKARSPKGAYGPFQLTAGTARELGVNRYDPVENIDGGLTYLKQQLDEFKDPTLGVAAYNAGPGAVRKHGGVPPFAETQDYVRKVLGEKAPPKFDPDAPAEVVPPAFDPKKPFDVLEAPGESSEPAAPPVAQPAKTPEAHPLMGALARLAEKVKGVGSTYDADRKERTAAAIEAMRGARSVSTDAEGRMNDPTEGLQDIIGGIGGAFSYAYAPIGAAIDTMTGRPLAKVLENAPHGKIGPLEYDARFGKNFLGDAVGQIGGQMVGGPKAGEIAAAERIPGPAEVVGRDAASRVGKGFRDAVFGEQLPKLAPEEAVSPGVGKFVDKNTSAPLSKGQEAAYEQMRASGELDPTAAPGSRNFPRAQRAPEDLPPPGEWFVDVTGELKQSPEIAPEAPRVAPETPQEPVEAPAAVMPHEEGPTAPTALPEPPPFDPAQPFEPVPVFDHAAPFEAVDDFPGDRMSQKPASIDAEKRDIEQAKTPEVDLTDRALDLIRGGKEVRQKRGQSLVDAFSAEGGVRNEGGELAAFDPRAYGRRGGRLVRQNGGMSLDDAALWAQERGYIGKPVEAGERASPQELLDALRRDLDGDRVYAKEDPKAAELAQHADDLEEMLHELGVDPHQASNAEIKKALNEYFSAPAERRDAIYGVRTPKSPDQLELPGVDGATDTKASILLELQRRSAKRDAQPMEAGGLFDEVRKGEQGLFDKPLGVRAYHGSKQADLSEIKPGERAGPFGRAAYLSPSDSVAKRYAGEGGKVYDVDAPDGVFDGMGRPADSKVNPYDVWRSQIDRLVAAAAPEKRAAITDLGAKMHPQDGYPFFRRLSQELGGDEAAQELMRSAGFRGVSGWVDGPEIAVFDAVPVKADLSPMVDGAARAKRMERLGVRASESPEVLAARLEGAGLADTPAPEATRRADVTKAEPLPKAAASVQKLIDQLARDTDATLRQGRMTLKGDDAMGEFNPLSGVARTKTWGQIDYASHEIGHHLDFKKLPNLDTAIRAHSRELIPLDYAPVDPKTGPRAAAINEGFAEFFRRYVTNPKAAKAAAPKFYDAFEAALRKDRAPMLRGIQRVQRDYARHRKAPVADQLIGSIHSLPGRKGTVGKLLERAKDTGVAEAVKASLVETYGNLIGNEAEMARAIGEMQSMYAQRTGRALNLEGAKNPVMVFRTLRTAFSDGFANMMYGVRHAGEETGSGPSLRAALELAYGKGFKKAARDDFKAYLVARRLVDEWDRYRAGKLPNQPWHKTKEQLAGGIADLEARNPTFREAADKFSDYAKAELQLDVEAGLLSQEAYDGMLAERPFYAPIQRLRKANERASGGSTLSGDGGEFAKTPKATRGSFRDFYDPVEVMMRRAMTQAVNRRFNMGVRAMKGLVNDVGEGAGKFVEEVPNTKMSAFNAEMDEVLREAAKKYDVAEEDLRDLWQAADIGLQPNDKITFFRRQPVGTDGDNVVFYWEDGKRHALQMADGQIGKAMVEFMVGLTPELQSALSGAAGRLTAVTRAGVTTSPAWALANMWRDMLDAWLKVPGAIPVFTQLSGLKEIALHTDIAKSFERFGRIKGGQVTTAMEHARNRVDPKTLKTRGATLRHFLHPQGIARLVEFSEVATRVGVYKLRRKRAIKKLGLDPESAAIHASNEAADYMPFDRHGRKMGGVAKWVPFLNAYIQGLDVTARTAVPGSALSKLLKGEALTRANHEELYKSGRYFALLSVPAAISLWQESMYHDDKDFQGASEYLRANNWLFKAEDLGLAQLDKAYAGKWVAIPKPFEHAIPGNILERQYEERVDGDELAGKKMWAGIADVMTPPANVVFISPWLQMERNRDFNGRPIIPEHLTGAGDPELKVNSYTSAFSRAAAHAMGSITEKLTGERRTFSPAMADHWITSLTTSWGRDFLSESSRVDALVKGKEQPSLGPDDEFVTQRFVKDLSRSSDYGKAFWDRMGKDDGKYEAAFNDFAQLSTDAKTQAEAYRRLAKLPEDERDYVLAKRFASDAAPDWPNPSALHPMIRAQDIGSAVGDLRQAIRDGALANASGPVTLTPEQRRQADDALSHLVMAEQANALIRSGVKGYGNRGELDIEADRQKLRAIDPGLIRALDETLAVRKIAPDATARRAWPALRDALRRAGDEQLQAATAHKQTRTTRGKYEALVRENAAVLDRN